MRYTIESESLKVTVESLGAELVSVVGADGYEYIWQADERYWKGHSPLLFPACGQLLNKEYTVGGRLYKMGGHGFARDFEFSVVKATKDELLFVLKHNDETLGLYPFEFTLEALYRVSGDRLTVDFTVKNEGESVMPYMFGWHPAFTLDTAGGSAIGDFSLKFGGVDSVNWYPLQHGCFVRPYSEKYALTDGAYVLDEKEIYENDTMIYTGTGDHALLSSAKEKHGVDFEWSANLPYFCVWKAPFTEARFICLEPWSDVPADGETPENFDVRKMSRLDGGKAEVYTYNVKFC